MWRSKHIYLVTIFKQEGFAIILNVYSTLFLYSNPNVIDDKYHVVFDKDCIFLRLGLQKYGIFEVDFTVDAVNLRNEMHSKKCVSIFSTLLEILLNESIVKYS